MKKFVFYFIITAILAAALSSCNNVTSVTLDKSELTIAEGETVALTATVLPDNATNKVLIWTSSNTGIATVNDKGEVTGRGIGTATITAKTENGKKAATCVVTVGARVIDITLKYNATTLVIGNSLTLTPTITPHNAVNKTVNWTSSNPDVATVDTTGTVTALSLGMTTITATTQNYGKKATCLINVTNACANGMILLTVKSYDVWFYITGSGMATIDWGDGTEVETFTLSCDGTKHYAGKHRHSYSDNNSFRSIIITGNITKFTCSDNDPNDSYFKLTRLDVSNNTALTYLNCSNNQLTNLDVSKNTALTYLDCSENQLTSLDVSKNTVLDELRCYRNQLTGLDVSKNTALTKLDCAINQLTNLDVSKNTVLSGLHCYANQLTNLDVSKNATLEYLQCSNNQLTNLDVSKNTVLIRLNCEKNKLTNLKTNNNNIALTYINCSNNQLTNLDVSKITVLDELDCTNNQLKNLDVSKNIILKALRCNGNQLTDLDMSKNTEFKALQCSNNQLKKINISQNAALSKLECNSNQLTNLDLSQNTWLVGLQCNDNQLTNLDLSKNISLMFLSCHTNQLTNLDVSKNTDLDRLNCNNNQLTNLDVSTNTRLKNLHCQSNKFTADALNVLFGTLPANSNWDEKYIYIYNNPGTENCYKSIAMNKGWAVITSKE